MWHIYMAWKFIKEIAIQKQREEKLNGAGVSPSHKVKSSKESVEDEYIELYPHLLFSEKTGSYIFVDESKGIRKYIIKERNICDFPGIENEKEISEYIEEGSLEPRICYDCYFELLSDGRILIEWTVQPDGRYWADEEGFGGTSDLEITLYSHIDVNGNFTGPFKICEDF